MLILFLYLFFDNFETDLDAFWHKVAFSPGKALIQQYLGKIKNKWNRGQKMHFGSAVCLNSRIEYRNSDQSDILKSSAPFLR